MLGDTADAQDAAQEALVRAWRAADSARHAGARGAWVRTIARREALRLLGARRRGEHIDEEAAELAAPEGDVSVNDSVDLRQALRILSGRDRQIVLKHYWEDLSCAETASALGLPEGTVKVRLHRARRRLRALLDHGGDRAQ